MKYTERIDHALRVAAMSHAEQKRKSTDIPYVMHPFAVMLLAETATDDEDTLIACVLHDVLEDASDKYDRSAMQEDFGLNVVQIVAGVTKDASMNDWKERSDAYLRHLEVAPVESVIVSAADKTHNLMSILIDYRQNGEAVWDRFNSSKYDQKWWYQSVGAVCMRRLPASDLLSSYRKLLDELNEIV